ncbi:MAG TPA: ABC transporter ATP-binding protein [bacterium]|nr:ABC transporter ATP-binding protein [bacterium]HQH80602.1 ABC transporter ATP-binding protein [bacterium]
MPHSQMRFIKTMKSYGLFTPATVVAIAFSAIFSALAFLLWVPAPEIARLLIDFAASEKNIRMMNACIAVSALSILASSALNFFALHLGTISSRQLSSTLSKKFFECAIANPESVSSCEEKERTIDLISHMPDRIASFLAGSLPRAFARGLGFFIISAMLWRIDPVISLMGFSAIFIRGMEENICQKLKISSFFEGVRSQRALEKRICERMEAAESVRAFAQAESESSAVATLLRRRDMAAIKSEVLEALCRLSSSPALKIWGLTVAWYTAYRLASGAITAGMALAAAIYTALLLTHLLHAKDFMLSFRAYREAARTSSEILSSQEKIPSGDGGISFEDFNYPSSAEMGVLPVSTRGILAIVGASEDEAKKFTGSMIRNLAEDETAAMVSENEISEISFGKVGEKIGFLSQKAVIFDGSIMENILYGSQQKERGDAIRAAQTVGADEFIEKLPGGYDTEAGPGGAYLSAMERNLVAMARVLLKDPSIIIFQEQDRLEELRNEYKFGETIVAISKTKKVIILASKLQSLKMADEIAFFSGGKISERGSFESLLKNSDEFRNYVSENFGSSKSFEHELLVEMERNARYGSKFSVAVIVITPKSIHPPEATPNEGDRIIDAAAAALSYIIRIVDSSAKTGKNSLAILLPEIDLDHLKQFSKRIRCSLPEKMKEFCKSVCPESLSIKLAGTCVVEKTNLSPEELIGMLTKIISESQNEDTTMIFPQSKAETGES